MRFKLSSLLLLLSAAGFLLAAFLPVIRSAHDHLYEIVIAFIGAVVAVILLVWLLVAEERPIASHDHSKRR
jgi:hypothetical protein